MGYLWEKSVFCVSILTFKEIVVRIKRIEYAEQRYNIGGESA